MSLPQRLSLFWSRLCYRLIACIARKYPCDLTSEWHERWPRLYAGHHLGPRADSFLHLPRMYEEALRPVPLDLSIVTYNSASWLTGFLQSLLGQDYPLEYIRLLCADNGSADDTLDILKTFQRDHQGRFADILITGGPNKGYGAGHNRNMALARAEFFLVSNVDLEFEKSSLSRIVAFAQHDSARAAAWELRQKPHEHPKFYDPVDFSTAWNSGACTLYRLSALHQVRGFDERLFMYCEDVDLSFRLRDAGFVLRYVPKATVMHYCYDDDLTPKPLQLVGSVLGNAFVRARFGTKRAVFELCDVVTRRAEASPEHVPRQREMLISQCGTLVRKLPYFLLTRKKSGTSFGFVDLNFELHREGATMKLQALPDAAILPLVSIVIRTHGQRQGLLREALATVSHQTYPNLEVLVVEDGGSEAKETVREIAGTTGLDIRYISIAKAGRSVAGNVGLQAAHGEFLMLFDDDDLLWADHVEVLALHLMASDAPAAYSRAWELPTLRKSLSPLAYEEDRIREYPHQRDVFSYERLCVGNLPTIQSVLFRREVFEKHGGLDIRLDALEDWNMWLRFACEGDFLCLHKTTSLYRMPAAPEDKEKRAAIHTSLEGVALKWAQKSECIDGLDTCSVLLRKDFLQKERPHEQ